MKYELTSKQILAASAAVRGKHPLLQDEIEDIYRAIVRTAPKRRPPTREQLIDFAYSCNKGAAVFDFLKFAALLHRYYTNDPS